MNLVKWTPWREMATIHNRVSRLFEDPFLRTSWFDDGLALTNWNPVIDIYDNDDTVVIKAELPGMDKKDISIDLKDGVLTLKGERSYDNEVKEENYHRKERAYGKFHRSFRLPENVDVDKIKADYKDGILKIDIPKPEEVKPKKVTVH